MKIILIVLSILSIHLTMDNVEAQTSTASISFTVPTDVPAIHNPIDDTTDKPNTKASAGPLTLDYVGNVSSQKDFIQVTDRRGSTGEWRLYVTSTPTVSDELILKNAGISSQTIMPSPSLGESAPMDSTSSVILNAQTNEGRGQWHYIWNDELLVNPQEDINLTWTLIDAP